MVIDVKRVDGWRTSDGTVFDQRDEAMKHEKKLVFVAWCETHVDRHMAAGEIAQAIWDHWFVDPRLGTLKT